MKYYGKFHDVAFRSLEPKGFLKKMLEREKNGVIGRLDEIGYPFNLKPWSSKEPVKTEFARWWPYEQTAYWIDSVSRLSLLLKDDELFKKVSDQVETSLKDADPYIGPNIIREKQPCCRWPHSVLFRAFYALWSGTENEKYMQKMHEHYLGDLNLEYGSDRTVMGTEMMLRVAEHFDDESLLTKAKASLDRFLSFYGPAVEYFFYNKKGLPPELNPDNDNMDMFTDIRNVFHGVSYNETAKLPAILYLFTGDRKYLDISLKAFKVMENRHILPDGVNSSGEFLQGDSSFAVHESCDVTDFTYFMGILLEATGDAQYAERIENVMFNAYFGAQTADYKAIQYFSSVNQVVSGPNTCYLEEFADEKMAYQPLHCPQCCIGNMGRALPNYVYRMFQTTEKGVAVSLFGDIDYKGENMEISMSGDYPYGDEVTLLVRKATEGKNELRVRLPKWSVETTLLLNGKEVRYDVENGYACLTVHTDDCVVLRTKKQFESHSSADGGVYFTYGPFLMTLKVDAKVSIDENAKLVTKEFPAYIMEAASEWRYAVTGFEFPTMTVPISHESRSFEITIEAKELKDWNLWHLSNAKCSNIVCTPPLPGSEFVRHHLGEKKTITLVPYGTTNLRLTVFPKYNDIYGFVFDI